MSIYQRLGSIGLIILVTVTILFTGLAMAQTAVAAPPLTQPTAPTFLPTANNCWATIDGITVYSSTNGTAVQTAVNAATAGELVKVAGFCTGVQTQNNLTQTVYIDKELTLQGGYTNTNWLAASNPTMYTTTLDAEINGRVAYITGTATVTLEGLTMINGRSVTGGGINSGGGIFVESGTVLTVSNSVLYGHEAQRGGAIYNNQGSLTIADTTIRNNITTNNGGGIYNGANSQATVLRSQFSNNNANSGGGLYNDGQMVIEKTTIANNYSQVYGGGLRNGTGRSLSVDKSTFSNNQSYYSGGGLDNTGIITIVNSTISGNTAITNDGGATSNRNSGIMTIAHSTIVSNTANGGHTGDGVWRDGGTVTVISSIIAYHADRDCKGGVTDGGGNIATDATCGFSMGDTDPLLDVLADNGGNGETHALLLGSPAINNVLVGVNGCGTTTVVDQRGHLRPYGDGCDSGAYEVISSCFVETTGDDVADFNSIGGQAVQNALNAAATGATLKVAGTCAGVQTQNSLTQTIYISQNVTIQGGYNVTDATADSNWLLLPDATTYPTTLDAEGNGRVVYADGANDIILSGLIIIDGYNLIDGGGVYNNGANLSINETQIVSNTIGRQGGGIYNNGGVLDINNSYIAYNRTTTTFGSGGGINNTSGSVVTISSSTIANNTSAWDGGGINNAGDAVMYIVDSAITDNNGRYGGGIKLFSRVSISNTTISDNYSSQDGGGIHNWGTLTVTNSLISDNIAQDDGGGVYNVKKVTFINTTISGNIGEGTVHGGGGGGIAQSQDGDPSSLTLRHTTVVSNTHNSAGGDGIHLFAGTATIYNTVIAYNDTENCSGGATFTSGDYNIEDGSSCNLIAAHDLPLTDPLLNPLDEISGIHSFQTDSPALDMIPMGINGCGLTYTEDQRGESRPQGSGCDSGAYEETVIPICSVEFTGDNISDFVSTDATAIQNAVNAATPGDTLKIAGTCAGVNVQGGLTQTTYIDQNLTLQGGYTHTNWLTAPDPVAYPTILDAEGNGRVVYITNSVSITLSHLTLTGGNDDGGDGGAIYNPAGATLIVQGSIITSNNARHGGGLYNSGTVIINQSTFANNNVNANGGGIFSPSGSVTINGSTFNGNSARWGGAAYVNNNSFGMIIGSTFISNTATANGGGLFNRGTTSVHNSTFSGNSAVSFGGSIYNIATPGFITVTYSTIANSHADTVNGGNIYNNGGSFNLAASILADNMGGGDCGHNSTPIIDNGNNLVEDGSCNFPVGGDPLIAPLADNGGSTTGSGQTTWTHALLDGSPVIDIIPEGVNGCGTTTTVDQRGQPRPYGGGCDSGAYETGVPVCFANLNGIIYSSVEAEAVQTAVNLATPGDLIKVAGTCAGVTAVSGTNQTVFISKTLTLKGGYSNTDWTISNPISNPTTLDAQQQGRVVRLFGTLSDTITLDSLIITQGMVGRFQDGGGIYNEGVRLTLIATTVSHNATRNNGIGGGIYNNDGAIIMLQSALISNTVGTRFGGGMYSNVSALSENEITLIDTIVSGNNGSDAGGGLHISGGIVTIRDSQIVSNSARYAAGLYLYENISVTIASSLIGYNIASGEAGMLVEYSPNVHILNSFIINNIATTYYVGGVSAYDESHLFFKNTTISGNVAQTDGGGIYVQDEAMVTLDGVTMQNNMAHGNGGGIFIDPTSMVTMTNTTLLNNVADSSGGAVANEGSFTAINSTLSGNTAYGTAADGGGGALYQAILTAVTDIIFSTIVSNTAPATVFDGLYVLTGTLNISSSIVAYNHEADCIWAGGVINSGGFNLASDSSCTFGAGSDQNNIDPLLAPIASGTHALQSDSPAVDVIAVGSNGCGTLYSSDQRGVARPQNTSCDIGAYESNIRALTVNLDGSGSVSSDPAGIDCESDCSEAYEYGTVVTLTAVSAISSTFTGWSGVCSGMGNCVVTMDAAQDVTATFDTKTHILFLPIIIK